MYGHWRILRHVFGGGMKILDLPVISQAHHHGHTKRPYGAVITISIIRNKYFGNHLYCRYPCQLQIHHISSHILSFFSPAIISSVYLSHPSITSTPAWYANGYTTGPKNASSGSSSSPAANSSSYSASCTYSCHTPARTAQSYPPNSRSTHHVPHVLLGSLPCPSITSIPL